MQKIRRAIVYGPGGLAGAHGAGFAYELCRALPADYFDTYIGCSVGNMNATFHASNQPDIIINIWANHVDGNKLINPLNLLRLHPLLNLNYLRRMSQNGIARLDKEILFSSPKKLQYILLDYDTGTASPEHPTKENIVDLMLAGCALPVINGLPGCIEVNGKRFLDCSFTNRIPALEQIASEHDEIILVLNYPEEDNMKMIEFVKNRVYPLVKIFYPKRLQEVFEGKAQREASFDEFLERNPKIKIIRPQKMTLKSGMDTNKTRLNETINSGRLSALSYLQQLTLKP